MTEECSLCGLATRPEPVSVPGVEGTFCCRGCLEVSRSLDTTDVDSASVREGARAARGRGEPTGDAGGDDTESSGDDATGAGEDGLEDAFLAVDGMHCTTCEAFLGHRGESVAGIASVRASYATDTARVRFDPEAVDRSELPGLLSGYGYTARFRDEDGSHDDRATVNRLVVGGFLAMLVMPWYLFFLYPRYVGIQVGILTADMTTAANVYFPMAVIAVLATGVVFYTGWPILRGAYVSLTTGRPNMDLLLAVAVLGSYSYSTVALATGSVHLYYDVSIAVVLVVTAGTYYERRLKRQATGLLTSLTEARVREATRRTSDETTEVVGVDDLAAGDEVLVRPGERVPADGTVVEGTAAVDEAILTGESMPDQRGPGDEVVGGAVVTDSSLVVEVGHGAENTLDRITSLLWSVQSDRRGIQRFADRIATVFVPLVLALAVAVTGWRLLAGQAASGALLAGLTVLVAACPCAMGLATPLAVAAGLRDALDRGVVVTNGALFEAAPDLDTVVFDKTGTLTTGEMTVHAVVGEERAIRVAAALERRSSHPVASAVVEYAESGGGIATDGGVEQADAGTDLDDPDATRVEGFERHPGEGVSGRVDGEAVVAGTRNLVERQCGPLPPNLAAAVEDATGAGRLPVVVGHGASPAAVLVVGDRERADWREVLGAFADREVVVLTGDEERAAERFRDHPAVDRVFAGVPPDGKVATVRRLRAEGTTAMVGDGTNDAPALAAADIGVAVASTARAAEAADVVVPDGRLVDVPAAFELASATRQRIRENVGWAFLYNAVVLPLAALGVLNPLFAAVAMAASSLLVVTNSRRAVR
jgi:Cu2+-exporting ATPase